MFKKIEHRSWQSYFPRKKIIKDTFHLFFYILIIQIDPWQRAKRIKILGLWVKLTIACNRRRGRRYMVCSGHKLVFFGIERKSSDFDELCFCWTVERSWMLGFRVSSTRIHILNLIYHRREGGSILKPVSGYGFLKNINNKNRQQEALRFCPSSSKRPIKKDKSVQLFFRGGRRQKSKRGVGRLIFFERFVRVVKLAPYLHPRLQATLRSKMV